MVEKFNLTNAKPVSTPMMVGTTFTREQSPSTVNQLARMKGVPYSEAIGSVLWPVVISRPDAAYSVGYCPNSYKIWAKLTGKVSNESLVISEAQRTYGLPLVGQARTY